jgi:hypothetical protein
MGFFQKASTGWEIAKNSYKVINANRSLLVFPLLSGISLLLIFSSIAIAVFGYSQGDLNNVNDSNTFLNYALLFLYYLVNYFIIVFFNTALTYSVARYFEGHEVSVKEGLAFSGSRIGLIFSWSLVAATAGTILQILQENLGFIGKIITGIIGVVFNVASFFVIPVMVFEELGPIDAFKRSSAIIKEKWGNAVGASFNFGFVQIIAFIIIGMVAVVLGNLIHWYVAAAFALLAILLLITVISAARVIFITALYKNVTGNPVEAFEQHYIDDLFVQK